MKIRGKLWLIALEAANSWTLPPGWSKGQHALWIALLIEGFWEQKSMLLLAGQVQRKESLSVLSPGSQSHEITQFPQATRKLPAQPIWRPLWRWTPRGSESLLLCPPLPSLNTGSGKQASSEAEQLGRCLLYDPDGNNVPAFPTGQLVLACGLWWSKQKMGESCLLNETCISN